MSLHKWCCSRLEMSTAHTVLPQRFKPKLAKIYMKDLQPGEPDYVSDLWIESVQFFTNVKKTDARCGKPLKSCACVHACVCAKSYT